MSLAALKDKRDGYTQSSTASKDATLCLETLKASAQLQDSDAAQLESVVITNETGDDAVITDLATLLIDKLFGKVFDSGELISDSDELTSEVLTELASVLSSDYKATSFTATPISDNTSIAYDKPIVESTTEHVKVKVSQRDDSSAGEINADDLSQFGQLMQILAPSQFAMVATQFIRSNVVETDSDCTTTENTVSDFATNSVQTTTTSLVVADVEADLDAQMDDIINEALESMAQKVADSKNETKSTEQKEVNSKDDKDSTTQKDKSDVDNALSARADDIVKNDFVAEQYQNLVDGGYTLPLIHECLMLFETKMSKKADEASKNVETSDVETESSIVDEVMSAYASLSGISFPYKTNIQNPRYVASNDFTNDGIDADGNSKYIVCNDLGSLFNYAYDSANSDNLDIGLLQSKLGGLYDQLCDFDPKFAMNIASNGFNSTNGINNAFDPQEFIKTFTDYVKYVNEYILIAL